MDYYATDMDKMLRKRTVKHFSPLKKGRRFFRSFSDYAREHLLTFLLGALFLLGILAGTLLVHQASERTLELLKTILGGYVENRALQPFTSIVTSTFFSNVILLLILFFCGFCTIAQLIIFLVPVFKGLGYGFSLGMLYLQYGTQAVPYVALLQLPTMFLSALLLIIACRSSLMLSVRFFKSTMVSPEEADRFRAKRYCVKYLACLLICLLIALLDAALCYKFGGLFVF